MLPRCLSPSLTLPGTRFRSLRPLQARCMPSKRASEDETLESAIARFGYGSAPTRTARRLGFKQAAQPSAGLIGTGSTRRRRFRIPREE